MKSIKFSSKSFLSHRINSYWYLSLFSAIVFFISMPFALNLVYGYNKNLNTMYGSENLNQTMIDITITFFQKDGMIATFLLAYFLANIIGLFLFSFLNDKKQVNFYHSQPLSRKKIFVSNYVAALVLGIIPFLVALSVALLISFFNVGNVLSPKIIFMQITGLIVFYNMGLSIAILACQLTGNKIFTLYVTGFLNFFIPLVITIILSTINGFTATLNISMSFINNTSPLLHYIVSIAAAGNKVFSLSQLMIYFVAGMLIVLVAFGLYSIRPSEASENTVVYKPISFFIKFITSFALAYGFASFCTLIGGLKFFNLSFIIIFFVAIFFIEAIFQKTFKDFKKIIIPSLISTIVGFGIIFGLSAYAQILDVQVPSSNKIESMSFKFSTDYYNSSNSVYNNVTISDPLLIEEMLNVIDKIVKTANYNNRKSLDVYAQNVYSDSYSIDLYVQYNNSDLMRRSYNNVDSRLIIEELTSIYENSLYKEAMIMGLTNAIENETLGLSKLNLFHLELFNKLDYVVNYTSNGYKDKYVQPIINAALIDIRERKFSDVIDMNTNSSKNIGYLYFYFIDNNSMEMTDIGMNVYNNDTQIMKIVDELSSDPEYTFIFDNYTDDKLID